MSGLFVQHAVKEKLKARIAIDGPTGAGKTWTAAQWAVILAGGKPMSQGGAPIGVVDTENRSAAYYAPTPGVEPKRVNPWDAPYEFFHLPVSAPYSPIALADIIGRAHEDLTEDGVLLIDSLTHFWSGEGGTMDIVDDAKSRNGGNNFAGWKEGTPAQRHMLDAIIHCRCHVIVTMRSKMEWVLEETIGSNGHKSSKPKKIGMAPEQRNGVEYEFTLVADMDLEHRVVISKSRCDAVADLVMPKGRSAEVAQTFAAWLGTGVNRVDEEQAREIAALFDDDALSKDDRLALKTAFVATFGKPAELLTDKMDAAVTWTLDRIARLKGEPEQLPMAAPLVAPEWSEAHDPEPRDPDDLPNADEGEPAADELAEHDGVDPEEGEHLTSLDRLTAAMAAPGEDGFMLEMDPPTEPEAPAVTKRGRGRQS